MREIYKNHPWLIRPAVVFFVLIFPVALVLKWIIDAYEDGVFKGSVEDLWDDLKYGWEYKPGDDK